MTLGRQFAEPGGTASKVDNGDPSGRSGRHLADKCNEFDGDVMACERGSSACYNASPKSGRDFDCSGIDTQKQCAAEGRRFCMWEGEAPRWGVTLSERSVHITLENGCSISGDFGRESGLFILERHLQ